jgi:cation:H+ antiporter
MWYSFYNDRKNPTESTESQESSTLPSVWISVLKIVGGLTLLILSCDIFIDKAVIVARKLGLSDAFISITLIACGTSLPELAASIMAALKKNTQLALGNILGSNIFNICLILGLSSQVIPLSSPDIPVRDYLWMIGAAAAPLIFGLRGRISRLSGALMFILYIVYTWSLLIQQIS